LRSKSASRAADIAALVVILLAGTLSGVWVFLVPIFQAPDEPAHFDYAISIYNARRLIHLSDGKPDWIVSPYTKYLMKATDFDRIMEHSSMRVPPGYGSKAYFARVGAGAPSLYEPTASSGRISYIVPTYPFGFYALEALWMRTVALFTGSLVTLFFAARLLCVFLLMAGLYFNYRAAINLGLPRWMSVALIAAIGCFPLTSMVSSYVQPDNLAYALVSASLFFATQLRAGTPTLKVALPLGLCLGLLAVTKYQFFLSAAAPIALLLAVRLALARPRGVQLLATSVILLAPTAALLGVQRWVVASSGATQAAQSVAASLFAPFRAAVAMGVVPTVHYVITTGVAAFTDFFLFGPCAATYWQVIGWVDTPIVIVNNNVEMLIRAAIAVCTAAVAVTLAFFLSRNAGRLIAAAPRGHARAVIAITARDPVLNSYLCIVTMLFLLYVLSNNVFGAEGRHWFPYIFPAFLCFVWYAPRAIRKRHQHISAALVVVLLSYAAFAATYALVDLTKRYYGPRTAQYAAAAPRSWQISHQPVDAVLYPPQSAEDHVGGAHVFFSYRVGSRVLITGAVLPNAQTGPAPVAVVLDRRKPLQVLYGQYQFRIAESLHSVQAGYGAFFAGVATAGLTEGPHTVAAFAETAGSRYVAINPSRIFFVTSGNSTFSQPLQKALWRAPVVDGDVKSVGTCRGVSSIARGTREVASGGVLLVKGRVATGSILHRYVAVWLLAAGHPYPTRYEARGGTFVGTVPTAALSPGAYSATAYAIRKDGSGSDRVARGTTFGVTALPGGTAFPQNPPRACADPLKELAGT
jgi:hypothetical protein